MSSTTPVVNFEITRGDDYSATVTFDQPVAGFTEIRFTMRTAWASNEADNAEAVYTTTLTPSGANAADLELPNADTVTWTDDSYFYDIAVITSAGSKKYTTQRGQLRMAPDVGR